MFRNTQHVQKGDPCYGGLNETSPAPCLLYLNTWSSDGGYLGLVGGGWGLLEEVCHPRVDFGVSKDSCHFELAPSASCCCELSAIPAVVASVWPSQTLALWNHKPKLALCS